MKHSQHYRFLLLLFILVHHANIFAQQIFSDTVSKPYIKTVRLKRTDLEFSAPVILLNSDDELELSFDDLRGNVANYTYTFTHCNQNWETSGLNYFNYLDGFENNTIKDYQYAFATLQKYTHYKVVFPNDDVKLLVSGNYIIRVWEENNDTVPIITRRFFIWEKLASVEPLVSRPNLVPYRQEYQEINFNVNIKDIDVSNPYDVIRVTLMQNNRTDNAYTELKPRLITNNVLYYDDDKTVFPAGKEYRRFDTKSLRFQTDRIKKIESGYNRYDVYINTDESRSYKQYFFEKDINGNFLIGSDLSRDADVEADYAYVHFTLSYPYYLSNGEFYVSGMFNNYILSNENKMKYDFDRQTYEATIYLKQGYYNYMYVFVDKNKPFYDLSYAEGNYFEAENDYSVFVYMHSYDKNYDRLVGYAVFNSINK